MGMNRILLGVVIYTNLPGIAKDAIWPSASVVNPALPKPCPGATGTDRGPNSRGGGCEASFPDSMFVVSKRT